MDHVESCKSLSLEFSSAAVTEKSESDEIEISDGFMKKNDVDVGVCATEQYFKLKRKWLRSKLKVSSTESSFSPSAEVARNFEEKCLQNLKDTSHRKSYCATDCINSSRKNVAMCSSRQIERIKLEALHHRIQSETIKLEKEIAEKKQKCSNYRQINYEIAQRNFISRKTSHLRKSFFNQAIEHHLYERNSITLLGEIVKTCVPPSAPGEIIWKKIRERQEHYAV